MSSSQPRDRHTDGFTLVELLIVIVVLGVLSGITILAVGQFKNDADSNSCAVDKRRLETAVTAYKASRDANPPSLADMTTTTPAFLDNEDIVGSTLVRDSYTLTYAPSTAEINDCTTALAAGGSGGTPTSAPTMTASATPTPVAPTVTSCTPNTISRGTATSVTIAGTDFGTDATVAVSGGGDVSAVVTARSGTSLTVTMTPTNGATRSDRTVTVSNPSSGLSGAKTACVTVTN